MTRRGITWLLATLLAVPLLAIGIVGLLAGTEAGTRWLARFAEPYLPAPLQIATPTGTLLGGVRFSSVRWEDERSSVEVRSVALNLELVPLVNRELRLTSLEADAVNIRIAPAETPDTSEPGLPQIELPFSLNLDAVRIGSVTLSLPGFEREIDALSAALVADRDRLAIEEFVVRSDWLDIDLRGRLRTTGLYRANLSADWRYRVRDDLNLRGRLSLSGDSERITVEHQLEEPRAIRSSGTIDDWPTALNFDLLHQWESIQATIAGRSLTSRDGRMTTRGALDDVAIDVTTQLEIEGLPGVSAALGGRTDWQRLDVDALALDSSAGSAVLAGGLDWSDGLSFDAAFEATDIDASLLSPRVEGRIGIDGSANGLVADGSQRIDARVMALDGTVNELPLSGSGDLRYDDDGISLSNALLALGENRLQLEGRIGDRLDLIADVSVTDAAALDPRFGGALQANARITGTSARPAIAAELGASDANWNGLRADSVEGVFGLTENRSVDVALEFARAGTESFVVETGSVRIDGGFDRHAIELLMENGTERLALAGTGSYVDDEWQARIERFDIDTGVLDAWSLEEAAAVEIAAGDVGLESLCISSVTTGGRLCAEGRYRPDESFLLLEMRRLPIAALPVTLPAGARLEGFIESDVDLRLAGGDLRGDAILRLVDAAMIALYEDEPYELRVSDAYVDADITNNRLTSTTSIVFNDGGGEARASLEIDDLLQSDAAIRGSGSLSVPDASIAAIFLPDISAPTGRIDGDLSVTGSLAAPDYSGEIRLEDAAFGVRPAGIRITDLTLRLSQLDAGRLQVRGSARSGEGEIRIDGATNVSADAGLRAELSLTGSDFELARLPDWRVAASPDIRLVLDDRTATVTGQLDVPTADITVNSVPETAVRPSGDVTVHGERPAEESQERRTRVDVVVGLGDDVRLTAFGLSTGVEGRVRIRGGTNEAYTGNGSLSLKEGRYKAYGQDLEIENGELVFNGRLDNPQLDVRAIRRIEADDVVAGIRLSGTPRQLRSEVYSEPAMRDAEALSYLLTGRPLSGSNAEDDDLLNSAAFALGLSQAGNIASQIRGDLGLDTLAVEGGSESGRIVAGKRFGDRLLVEYGYGIIDQLGTLLLRYQLSNRLVLESRTGTVSELDLVYSVKKK